MDGPYVYFTNVLVDGTRKQLQTYADENGEVGAAGWAQWRDERAVYMGGLPDIDYSIGLDTIFTSVVGHAYLSGELKFGNLKRANCSMNYVARNDIDRRLQGTSSDHRLEDRLCEWRVSSR